MNINLEKMYKRQYKLLDFNHLMKIYESNYYLINNLFNLNFNHRKLSTFVTNHQVLQYEPITISKYTSIFKLYYKFHNYKFYPKEYYIKPHIIFTLYNDAKLLEANTIEQAKEFGCCIKEKIKINLYIFFWLKSYN